MGLGTAAIQPNVRRLMIYGIIIGAMALYYIDTLLSLSHRNVDNISQLVVSDLLEDDRISYCPKGHRILTTDSGDGNRIDLLCKFLEFALRHDIHPKILGWQQTWHGFITKVFLLKEELVQYPPDCIVLYVDTDVMFQQGTEEIVEKYIDRLKSPKVLIGGECGCYPWIIWDEGQHKCTDAYPESPTKYRYGNAGVFMGRAEDLYAFQEAIWKRAGGWLNPQADDQALATAVHTQNPETFGTAIDHYAEISQSMYGFGQTHPGYENFKWKATVLPNPKDDDENSCAPHRHLVFDKGFWRNNYTKSTPSLFHFNGVTKNPQLADPYVDAARKARHEMLGPEKSQQEILRVKQTIVELGNGSHPTFAQLCPAYTDIDKDYK